MSVLAFERDLVPFGGGEWAMLGQWRVGKVYVDGMRPMGDSKPYKATCELPGIRSDLGNFETEKEAKGRVVRAVRVWLEGLPVDEEGRLAFP